MRGRNGAAGRSSAHPPIAPPIRSPWRTEDAAHVADGGIHTAALTERPPDADPLVELVGPAWNSAGAGQLPASVPAPDR